MHSFHLKVDRDALNADVSCTESLWGGRETFVTVDHRFFIFRLDVTLAHHRWNTKTTAFCNLGQSVFESIFFELELACSSIARILEGNRNRRGRESCIQERNRASNFFLSPDHTGIDRLSAEKLAILSEVRILSERGTNSE